MEVGVPGCRETALVSSGDAVRLVLSGVKGVRFAVPVSKIIDCFLNRTARLLEGGNGLGEIRWNEAMTRAVVTSPGFPRPLCSRH